MTVQHPARPVPTDRQAGADVRADVRVAVLVGSLREGSVNRRIAEMLRDAAPDGVRLELVQGLGDIPFYNEDLDGDAAPAAATALRTAVAGADRVLAVTPEYNGTMPAVLNNALDWLSRPFGAGAISGKPFGVVGATPTPYGGKWSHADAARSAGIAGATVVEDVTVSQSAIEVDPLADADVRAKLLTALRVLVEAEPAAAAA